MIRIIGLQKVVVIAVLAFLLCGFYLYDVYGLQPSIIANQVELSKNQAEITQMTEDMDKLVKGMEQFQADHMLFASVQNRGFFDPQDRVLANQRLNAMQQESQLLSASFTIKPAIIEQNAMAEEAGYKIMNTDIDLTLEALEDKDIYTFLNLFNNGFPGEITITDLSIERAAEITIPFLQKIGTGDVEPTLRANLVAVWRTMVPDENAVKKENAENAEPTENTENAEPTENTEPQEGVN